MSSTERLTRRSPVTDRAFGRSSAPAGTGARTGRVVYVGQLQYGGRALHRAEALSSLGCDVRLVDSRQPLHGLRGLNRRAIKKLTGASIDSSAVNRRLLECVLGLDTDVLWIDKGIEIRPATLREVRKTHPRTALVHYSPDDMFAKHNSSPRYRRGLALYDLHVTTKSFNVSELREMGARCVVFVDNAYDPATHRPLRLSREDQLRYGADIAFVGTYEPDRARQIKLLARRGLSVRVWGENWPGSRLFHPNVDVKGRPVMGDEYAMVLNASRINLCFLSKRNRDLQTTRSVEIPASGAFMLAERTPEHLRLFEEGTEAEFFSDGDELYRKCVTFLGKDGEREAIARSGRQRCIRDGYSNRERLRPVLETLADRYEHD